MTQIRKSLRCVSHWNLKKHGVSLEDINTRLIELEYLEWPALTPETEGTEAQWLSILRRENTCWHALIDEQRLVVGGLVAIPLNDLTTARCAKGLFAGGSFNPDSCLVPENIWPLANIYLDTAIIHPVYRRQGGLEKLVCMFLFWLRHVELLQHQKPDVWAVTVSPSGERLARRLGLEPVVPCTVGLGGTVYAGKCGWEKLLTRAEVRQLLRRK